jgi:hypothetical protein
MVFFIDSNSVFETIVLAADQDDRQPCFSADQKQFPLFRALYVRWRPGEEFSRECLKPTVKHGRGKIMVWGCVSGADGMGKLKKG